MSITNELRKAFDDCTVMAGVEDDFECVYITKSAALTYLDDIDAEHEKELAGVWDSIGDESVMAENGWVRLPKDADGKVIHVGDVITHVPDGIKELAPETVKHIVLSKDEQRIVTEECSYSMPKFLRHYKPTVEDLLQEFSNKVCNSGHQWGLDAADTIAEYAERIRKAVRDA